MKKCVKSALSILLALTLVFGTAAIAFAEKAECDCGDAPVVFVEGIGTTLYLKDKNGEEKTAFPMSTDIILTSLAKFIPTVLISTTFGGWNSFSKSLALFAGELFSEVDCDENGDSVLPVYAEEPDEPLVSEHTDGTNIYSFRYDWRLDPYETAKKLDKYIDEIIKATGHSKVVLSAYSEGGEITLAYLDAYGSSKLEKYITQCSAFQGLTLIGEVFTNNVGVDGKVLADFLVNIVGNTGADDGVVKLLDFLRYTGIYAGVAKLLDTVLDNCFADIYDVIARDMFACMPGIFNFVPASYFDKAIDMLFGNDKKTYSKLIERVTRYHKAQVNAKSIIEKAHKNGVAIALVSNYDCYPMPLTGDIIYQSDMLIDSANSSGGAAFAPLGETFADGYKQANKDEHNHLSPDGKVDASTCMFPEYTWFVAGYNHWNTCDEFIHWLYWYDGQPNVSTNKNYPQFMRGNAAALTVAPQK
ncbi:MAG: hypothetical protein IKK85_10450 [Clostridia bacterium]|nr:hypothetical protein [Clostridia bacterium]